jgi:hypothetical protein
MTSDTDRGKLVLVVLSSEQREARAAEFERFRLPGIELRFEESPEVGLDIAKAEAPALVIVGMTVGAIEGLEFVALFVRARPDFQGKVIVLPDKGDPFSPVVHARDPATGKSATETVDFAGVEKLIMALAQPVAAPAQPAVALPQPVAAPAQPAATPAQLVATPAPMAKMPAAASAAAGVGIAAAPAASQASNEGAAARVDKAASALAAGPRPDPSAAGRPQAPGHALQQGGAREAAALRLPPRPTRPAQSHLQRAATPTAPDKAPAASRFGRAHPAGPDWLSQSAAASAAPRKEPLAPLGNDSNTPFTKESIKEPITAAPPAQPSPQGTSGAVTVPAPSMAEFAQASAVADGPDGAPAARLAPPPVVIPKSPLPYQSAPPGSAPIAVARKDRLATFKARAMAWWSAKEPRERRVAAVSFIAVLALVTIAMVALAMTVHPSSAVPNAQSSPQNSHN